MLPSTGDPEPVLHDVHGESPIVPGIGCARRAYHASRARPMAIPSRNPTRPCLIIAALDVEHMSAHSQRVCEGAGRPWRVLEEYSERKLGPEEARSSSRKKAGG